MPRESGNVFAVVLAAGIASRFGQTKQLATIDGETLVARATRVAGEACGPRCVLVTGHDGRAVAESASGVTQFLVVNDRFEDGMGTSIAVAVRALAHVADAILLLLADQPLVTAAHLESLIQTWNGKDEIVATAFAGTQGPPVLFPREAFDALCALSGDVGARSLLEDPRFDVKTVAFEDAAIDIDSPADLARL